MSRPSRRHRPRGRRLRAFVLLAAVVAALFAAATVATGAKAAMPVRVAGDAAVRLPAAPDVAEYPFRSAPFDSYGFVAGECTSFVAWWLNAHGVPFGVLTVGPSGTGRFLNASTWDAAARQAGWKVGTTPVVGAVAQWHAGETSTVRREDGSPATFAAGGPGHVAVVTAVLPDGEVRWAEYGRNGKPELHLGRGSAPRYLYIGVRPPG